MWRFVLISLALVNVNLGEASAALVINTPNLLPQRAWANRGGGWEEMTATRNDRVTFVLAGPVDSTVVYFKFSGHPHVYKGGEHGTGPKLSTDGHYRYQLDRSGALYRVNHPHEGGTDFFLFGSYATVGHPVNEFHIFLAWAVWFAFGILAIEKMGVW
jgi:hypothetical protein